MKQQYAKTAGMGYEPGFSADGSKYALSLREGATALKITRNLTLISTNCMSICNHRNVAPKGAERHFAAAARIFSIGTRSNPLDLTYHADLP